MGGFSLSFIFINSILIDSIKVRRNYEIEKTKKQNKNWFIIKIHRNFMKYLKKIFVTNLKI